MTSAKNKRLNRVVVYYHETKTRDLLTGDKLVAEGVGIDEAHRFLHGLERKGDTVWHEPSFDEKLIAIAAKLAADCERIMLACCDSQTVLDDQYRRIKSHNVVLR